MSVPAVVPAADRLEALGRGASPRRKPASGPTQLTGRHHLLISYMIDGCQHPDLLARIKREKAVINEAGEPVIALVPPDVGEPLTLIEAADLLRIRRRNARELHGLPIFQKAYNAALESYRNGERAASLRTMVLVRDEPGLDKAADRKVRLAAAGMLLGELGGKSAGSTITINNAVGVQTMPGIVIDLRDDDEVEAGVPSTETKLMVELERMTPAESSRKATEQTLALLGRIIIERDQTTRWLDNRDAARRNVRATGGTEQDAIRMVYDAGDKPLQSPRPRLVGTES